MNPEFVSCRRELGEEKVAAFEAFCFHRAGTVARPFTALMCSPMFGDEKAVAAIVQRVFEAAKGDFDSERLCEALVRALEGPGVMPGLVEVRGGSSVLYVESRNIYQERGAPFTLENLLAPVHHGLSADPEFYFENVRGSGMDVLLGVFHLTKRGAEFCMACFPERVKKLLAAEKARNG